jgi:pimeloyl-ACP methyl ester carboxylesterase
MSTKPNAPEPRTVTSADGSTIAYDLSGSGPVVVLIAQALADRKDHRRLAALLTEDHTVVNFDRRGRGDSTEASPWSVEREVEDIEALIDAHGESAAVFGASSGAVLALQAASTLPDKIRQVVSFEAPVIVDDGRAPISRELADRLRELVGSGKRSEAVSLFMKQALGAPAAMVYGMRLMVPVWRQMTAMAHTAAYEVELCAGLQDGGPIPEDRWTDVTAPALVMVGEKSEPWAHNSAKAVADRVHARVQTVPKAHHGTPTMKPQAIIGELRKFFDAEPDVGGWT